MKENNEMLNNELSIFKFSKFGDLEKCEQIFNII